MCYTITNVMKHDKKSNGKRHLDEIYHEFIESMVYTNYPRVLLEPEDVTNYLGKRTMTVDAVDRITRKIYHRYAADSFNRREDIRKTLKYLWRRQVAFDYLERIKPLPIPDHSFEKIRNKITELILDPHEPVRGIDLVVKRDDDYYEVTCPMDEKGSKKCKYHWIIAIRNIIEETGIPWNRDPNDVLLNSFVDWYWKKPKSGEYIVKKFGLENYTDDIKQKILLKLSAYSHKITKDPISWCSQIVKNNCKDIVKKNKQEKKQIKELVETIKTEQDIYSTDDFPPEEITPEQSAEEYAAELRKRCPPAGKDNLNCRGINDRNIRRKEYGTLEFRIHLYLEYLNNKILKIKRNKTRAIPETFKVSLYIANNIIKSFDVCGKCLENKPKTEKKHGKI